MKWSLEDLSRYHDEPLHLATTFDLNAMMTKRFPEQILAVAPIKVDGYWSFDKGDATIGMHVDTTVTTPSSRSLEPVELQLSFDITESYTNEHSHFDRYDDDEVVFYLEDDELIDLDRILSENIVEQIPLKVLTAAEKAGEALPKGKDWSVITEDQLDQKQHQQVDPRFAKLKNLFPDQDNGK